jgi:hypothetical protein
MNLTLVEAAPAPRAAPADPPPALQQLSLLARALSDVMLANVQNAASLNLSAARALLAHARMPAPAALDRRNETWRWTWRNFEICATSADQVLNLTRGHVDRTTAGLWRAVERLIGELAQLQDTQIDALRGAFEALRAAQAAYWQAAQNAHSELIALAQQPPPPPLVQEEPRHAH